MTLVVLLNATLSVASATFTFGQQMELGILPPVILSQIFSALVFFSVAFMVGELTRRSSLSYILASAVFFTSQIAGIYLNLINTLTGNAFYLVVDRYLPTSPVDSLPVLVGQPSLPTGALPLLRLVGINSVETSIPLCIALIAVYAVVAIVLASGAVPAEGIALIPVAGIIVGNAMTANTLVGRRGFAALREEHDQYLAALSLGMRPAAAIDLSLHRRAPEALLPGLDQVSTTGLVTLPGAFIGVMLGGGTPVQAATTQALVLFGIMAAQTITVAVGERLIEARLLLPEDLEARLID